ncbi:50S ribosomal protein L25 [Acidiluteibacter ferrifornacis]|uniref:Large ribosomal subunit protein bL25 n=1 Tax=Acidiluteibacter ferrifornacis TaxID=2692424 RepID=A0A6N9NI28_9FLAO|nr:50S ribosomal protein L25 [Acidiluteibacter ferrifornacis]MBR9830833.1 50S ribosomal protein L25 [bacterium]NBG64857.1 50S ribosomal protein L25 [Acidiluteibacter ferrifornacis]
MKSVALEASVRDSIRNKSALNQLRKEGNIPAVLYGGENNTHLTVEEIAFGKLINTPEVHLVELNFDGKKVKAVIRDVQFHPVTDKPIHIDFYEVFEDKPMTMGIPVRVVGNSIGIKNGGKRSDKLRKLVSKALPSDMPDVIEVDITKLRIGQSIKVQDIKMDGVEFLDTPNAVVVAVKTSRVAVNTDDEEEEEEGAEATAEATEAAAE